MNTDELEKRVNDTREVWGKIILEFQDILRRNTRHCTNCDWFNVTNEHCKKVDKRPPAHIIVSGCEEHQDEIPF